MRLTARRQHGIVLGLYFVLALLSTWPLAIHITTHVPGSDTWAHDEYTFLWSMWWLKHSAVDMGHSLFYSQGIFYPLGMELILYTYNLMAAILALPLGVAANWIVAANATLLFSVTLSGFGAYLLAQWLLRGHEQGRLAAFIAGVVFAYASNRGIYLALGHYNVHNVQYLPFFVLYLLRLVERPNRHNAALAGLFGALNLLVDMQLGVFLAFLAFCLLITKPLRPLLVRGPQRRQRWLGLAGAAAVMVLLTAPYLWDTVQSMRSASFLLAGWGDALKLSADLAGWFTPTALHPMWGTDWVRYLRAVQEGTAPFLDVNTVFWGFVTTALALVGAITAWRRTRGWLLALILSALFTLGPLLQVRGRYLFDFDGLQTSVPLPFLLLHYLPFVKGNRTANRWSIVLMLSLAVLAAWGAAALLARLRGQEKRALRAGLVAVLAVAILFEHATAPLPLSDARIPAAVQQLAALPDGAVLQLPLGWRNSFGVAGAEDTRVQYYQSAHGKPILSGNTSRNPPIKFDYFQRLPLVKAITDQEFGHTPDAATLAAARDQVNDLVTLWGVRYLMTTPPVPGRLPYADNWQATEQLALDLIPHEAEPVADDGQVRVYGVKPGAPLPLDLDFGARVTDAWRGEGWSVDESDVGGANGIWATGDRAHLLFRSEDAAPRRLTLRAAPFTWAGAPPQRLRLILNGTEVGETTLGEGWSEPAFDIVPQPGINHLWLEFSRADSPRQRLNQAMIGSTGVQAPVNLEVHSFDQAFITVTGPDGQAQPASSGRRGYNVTVLNPRDGTVIDQRGFDTVANVYEVERLVDYLDHLPAGQIVILATRDGAGALVTPELVRALRRLGSGVNDPSALLSQAHALVGVVGAAPGTAAEVVQPADAFLRIAGDFRSLAAAIDWLRVE